MWLIGNSELTGKAKEYGFSGFSIKIGLLVMIIATSEDVIED